MSDHESESKELPPDFLSEPKDLTTHLGILKQIDILQNMIARMNANSMSCKTWCAALTSGILVASRGGEIILYAGIAIPILFYFFDVSYLGMEQNIRDLYKDFVDNLHEGKVPKRDLFRIDGSAIRDGRYNFDSLFSWSTIPYYLALTIILCVSPCFEVIKSWF